MHLLLSNPLKHAANAEATAAAAAAAAAARAGSKAAGASPRGGVSSPSRGGGGAAASPGRGGGRRGPATAAALEPPPAWCPSQHMVCAEFGWRAGELPGADVQMFVEQCAIAVSGVLRQKGQ